MVLSCARDPHCPGQDYALACLYVISGDVVYSSLGDLRKRSVLMLSNQVKEDDCPEIRKWKQETMDLFDGRIELVYDFWFFDKFLSPSPSS